MHSDEYNDKVLVQLCSRCTCSHDQFYERMDYIVERYLHFLACLRGIRSAVVARWTIGQQVERSILRQGQVS